MVPASIGQQGLGRRFGHVGAGHSLMDGLGHAGCGLTRWSGEGHLQRSAVVDGQLVEGREYPGHGVGLAGARTTSQHSDPAGKCHPGHRAVGDRVGPDSGGRRTGRAQCRWPLPRPRWRGGERRTA